MLASSPWQRTRPPRPDLGPQRTGVLQPGAGVEDDHLVVFGQPAGLAQLADRGNAGRALRADHGAFKPGDLALVGQQRLVVDRDSRSAGGVHGIEYQEIAEGLGDRDAERDRAGLRPRLTLPGSASERRHDRRAATGLDGYQARQLPAD